MGVLGFIILIVGALFVGWIVLGWDGVYATVNAIIQKFGEFVSSGIGEVQERI